jgi:hypothetical protein
MFWLGVATGFSATVLFELIVLIVAVAQVDKNRNK